MSWVKIDDAMPEHPKIVGLSHAAFRMQIEGLCYTARNLTDGFIPAPIAHRMITRGSKFAHELVSHGVWDSAPNGYQIHDYHDYNPSADEALDLKRKRAEAGHRGGKRSRPPEAKPEANASPVASPPLPIGLKQNGSKTEPRTRTPTELTPSGVNSDARDTIWNTYRSYHATAVLTPKRAKLIHDRLNDGYTPETLTDAIHGNHRDAWCNGDNPNGRKHHSLELILRDAEHIERYAATPTNGHAKQKLGPADLIRLAGDLDNDASRNHDAPSQSMRSLPPPRSAA